MSARDIDFGRKIEYAEQWLNKAKTELSSGSSVQAASHVILAIAEMETLKNAIFGVEHKPIELPKQGRRFRFDYRPILAAAMFLLALSIFTYSPHYELPNPLPNITVSDSHLDTILSDLSERKIPSWLSMPEISMPVLSEKSKSNETYAKSSESASMSKNRQGGSKRKSASVKQPKPETDVVDSVGIKMVDSSLAVEKIPTSSELDPDRISLDVILAAKESLNAD